MHLAHAHNTGSALSVTSAADAEDRARSGELAERLRRRDPRAVEELYRELSSRVVIDATGQRSLLARRFKLRQSDPCLKMAAIFTHFEGAQRDEGIDEGATLILQTRGNRGWFWYIPLPDDQVSVGVVGPIETLLHGRSGDLQAVFDELLDGLRGVIAFLAQVLALDDLHPHASQLLEESPQIRLSEMRLIHIIQNHAKRMNGIVENILQLSRREQSQPEVVPLHLFLPEFAMEFETSKVNHSLEFTTVFPPDPAHVLYDKSQLHQCLWKLLDNASDHASRHNMTPKVKLELATYDESGFCVITIADNGPGIPEDQIEKIFEPFYSTRKEGSGLGLYIARELAELHPKWPSPLETLVIREKRATFASTVGVDLIRPDQQTPVHGLWLAGDYTETDLPATLEGAVRSGQHCATEILAERARLSP